MTFPDLAVLPEELEQRARSAPHPDVRRIVGRLASLLREGRPGDGALFLAEELGKLTRDRDQARTQLDTLRRMWPRG